MYYKKLKQIINNKSDASKSNYGGSDGTRTRDLLRDRQAF